MKIAKQKIINECYQKSKELLIKNSNYYGVLASSVSALAKKKLYVNIFARDASICALGMLASKSEELIKIAKCSIVTLANYQTKLGQIPYSVDPKEKHALFYFLGSIDSTLWWLIALDFYHKYSNDKKLYKKLEPNIKKALRWLHYQDVNNCGLLEQNEASDWADDMPNNGIVLYTNVLWSIVLNLYKLEARELVFDGLNSLFLPHKANLKRSIYLQRDAYRLNWFKTFRKNIKDVPHYLHYISYRYASDRCDVYSNCLAILFNIAPPARAQSIIRFLRNNNVSQKYPVQVLFPPIKSNDHDWRQYLEQERCANKPYGYHNGGIWPYIGCFYVMSLHKVGKTDLAWKELARVAEANKVNKWQFNEWFHGKTGRPMGMAGQSWNAGTFLLAYHYLLSDIDF